MKGEVVLVGDHASFTPQRKKQGERCRPWRYFSENLPFVFTTRSVMEER